MNITATALSMGMSVLVTSSNSKALTAFCEKLPDNMRSLALDLSCFADGDVTKLLQAMEVLIMALNNLKAVDGNIITVRNARRPSVEMCFQAKV